MNTSPGIISGYGRVRDRDLETETPDIHDILHNNKIDCVQINISPCARSLEDKPCSQLATLFDEHL